MTKRIQQLQERVAKYEGAVRDEQAEVHRLSGELRKMMSVRNPRGRQLSERKRRAERRLGTARMRADTARRALAEARMEGEARKTLERTLESLRIDTIICQKKLEEGDAGAVAYYLPRLTRWARIANGEVTL